LHAGHDIFVGRVKYVGIAVEEDEEEVFLEASLGAMFIAWPS
jgi:hypothetical protein